MRPSVDRVLQQLAANLVTEVAPVVSVDYVQRNTGLVSGLLMFAAEEWDRAAQRRIEENRELRRMFAEAVIHVERPSQKGILIGASGAMIRQIGTISRRKIEDLLGQRVYLDLHVKVLRNWRKREGSLKLLGFQRPR